MSKCVAMERKRGSLPCATASKRGKRGNEKDDGVKSHELGRSFDDLPLTITNDILLRLPTKPLLICKRVCRTWKTLISDPHFAKLHFERSPISFMIRTSNPKLVSRTMYLLEDEPQELESECYNILKLKPTFKLPLCGAKLVLDKQDGTDGLLVREAKDHRFNVANSCNGLLCLSDPLKKDPLAVCNPVTGEFIRLPEITTLKKHVKTICSGIGFQPKTNEYKVVIMRRSYDYGWMSVEINVVGTPTWRIVRVNNFFHEGWLEYPTFVNGALHWVYFFGRCIILCFNFETEKLQRIFLPYLPFLKNGILHKECISMGALRDSLYVCNASLPSSMDVWIMKKDGTTISWTKDFTLKRAPHRGISVCWLVKHFEMGTAILDYHSKKGFTYYDPETNQSKKFLISGIKDKLLEVIPHIPNLISLKDVFRGYNVEVLNIHSW